MVSLKDFKKYEIKDDILSVKGGIACDQIIEVIDYLSSFPPGSNEYEQGKVVTSMLAKGQIQCT